MDQFQDKIKINNVHWIVGKDLNVPYYFLNKMIIEILYPMYVPIVFKITSSISEVLKDIINWTTSILADKNKPIRITFFDLLMDVKINPNGTNRMIFPKILIINCLISNTLNMLMNGIKFNPPSETPIPKEATGKNVNLKINKSEKINSIFMNIGFKINLPKMF
ncbi:hypothetical protein [Gottfriedia acidiceleris]|nr:hypothetical protein [Gottfriedia acidiceleris]